MHHHFQPPDVSGTDRHGTNPVKLITEATHSPPLASLRGIDAACSAATLLARPFSLYATYHSTDHDNHCCTAHISLPPGRQLVSGAPVDPVPALE